MHVLATAGHVDHGKSTLVRALTGINPDRLREEQRREMTIDLGFAWMTLPPAASDQLPATSNQPPTASRQIGIIDVPGHIDFIDNMLAGVGGIDAALLVIAADEGPMPQTLEHLAVLSLLRVQRGVVVLTKTDLAPDAEWIEIVGADVRALLSGTPLADAPIVPVSVRQGRGLTELTSALARVLAEAPPRRDIGKARLPVDRAFTLPGFGTIVTGTLVDGTFVVGDEVEIINQRGERLPVRIRGLQTHKQKLERALPGSRVAINLTGVDVDQVARGSVVARPGTLAPTTLVDVRIEVLPSASMGDVRRTPSLRSEVRRTLSLRHNAEVKVFSGAAYSLAKAWLLDGDELAGGSIGWAQLQLATPMALANGDRFIVRLPSPSITIGGGTVIDAYPVMRYRRKAGRADDAVLSRLQALSQGTPKERLLNALGELRFATADEATRKAQITADEMTLAMTTLTASGAVVVSQDILARAETWRDVQVEAATILVAFHSAQPLLVGMPRDTLRSRLKLTANVFNALLYLGGHITDAGDVVRLASHQVRFAATQQRAVDALLAQCRAQPWATPSVKDARAAVGDDVFESLLRQKQFVQIGPDVILLPDTFAQAVDDVRTFIQREGAMTAAQVRDLFGTSRKYALALMEHLDAAGVTKRVGDARVLK